MATYVGDFLDPQQHAYITYQVTVITSGCERRTSQHWGRHCLVALPAITYRNTTTATTTQILQRMIHCPNEARRQQSRRR